MTILFVGDQILNLDNIVTFDIDNGVIVRIWYIGSSTPVTPQPPIPFQAVTAALSRKGLI